MNCKVVAVVSHDTASVIAAITADNNNWAFLSFRTCSQIGILSEEPIITQVVMLNDFRNQGGVQNKILFMRNIT